MTQFNSNERMLKFLQAPPDQQRAFDNILAGKTPCQSTVESGPLLLGMSAAAKFLGVSRATFWRMIKAGIVTKVELLPGSFRVRKADLEALVK